MAQYICQICGYLHDEETGGPFSELPDSWTCPVCGALKDQFEQEESGPPTAESSLPGEPGEPSDSGGPM